MAVGNFVIVLNVEAAASTILSQISTQSATERIYTPTSFLKTFSHALSTTSTLTPSDLSILLTYLSRDKSALSYTSTTIKFADPTSAAPPSPITPHDTTIANLHSLITSLRQQIPTLESRVADLNNQARTAVHTKSRTTALSALRSRKMVESTLAKRVDTLAQLEETFAKIEAAADNVAIVRAMEGSASVLRDLNRQVGGTEGVEGVVDALREEMEKVDEVSGVINEVGAGGMGIDESEVDEEFEALERAESEKVEARERGEREKRKAEEAEKTRARLEEVDALERARRAKEAQNTDAARKMGSEEDLLARSIEGMENMSLESARKTKPEDANEHEVLVKEKESATAN